jgi:hypothetical protein
MAADRLGTPTLCPNCRKQSEFHLAVPEAPESGLSRKALAWAVIGVGVLAACLAISLLGLNLARKRIAPSEHVVPAGKPLESPISSGFKGLELSQLRLEKAPDDPLPVVTAVIKNTSNSRRLRVRVNLDLLDGSGKVVGSVADFKAVLEAGAEWKLRTPALEGSAVSARMRSLETD